jgi:hypothetical protein
MHNALRLGGLVCAAAAFALPAFAQSTPAKPAAPAPSAAAKPAAPAAEQSPTKGLVLPPSNATVIPTYNSMNAETMMAIIRAAQGQVQITPDGSDPAGPMLKVQMPNGLNYTVLMDDCDGGQPALCKSLEFRATLPPGSLNFAQVNSFNETMRYATAYLSDKGVPQLRMDTDLRGGTTADHIAYAVRIFVKLVGDYVVQAKP